MNDPMEGQPREWKLLGLPRPLAGALIGALLFWLSVLLVRILARFSVIFIFFMIDLEIFGRLIFSSFSRLAGIEKSENITTIVSVILSAIPPAIFGWLIGSYKKFTRVVGIVLLVLYLFLTLVLGTLLFMIGI